MRISPFRCSPRNEIRTLVVPADDKRSQGSKCSYLEVCRQTSVAETVHKGAPTNAQTAVTSVECWSRKNFMELHPGKCKELIVDFSKDKQVFDSIKIKGECTQLSLRQRF